MEVKILNITVKDFDDIAIIVHVELIIKKLQCIWVRRIIKKYNFVVIF